VSYLTDSIKRGRSSAFGSLDSISSAILFDCIEQNNYGKTLLMIDSIKISITLTDCAVEQADADTP